MDPLEDRPGFMKELFEFLHARGAPNPKVPMIGGKELDLFTLYKSVTSRGGAENVSNNKLWKEIVNEFELPASCTSASFTLKNHYQKYLLAFEQKFFFKREDPEMLPELGNQRRMREGKFLFKREELPPAPQDPRAEHSHSLRENMLRVYGDKTKTADDIYCVGRGALGPTPAEAKRIILAFESLLPAEIRYALNAFLLYSCSRHAPFALDSHRVLYNAFEGYFSQLKAQLERTRYLLGPRAALRDERLPGRDERERLAEESPPLPVCELLEQFKIMLTVIRNLVLLPANEEFFAKDAKLCETLFALFIAVNEAELARLALEILCVLSRHLALGPKPAAEQRRFLDRLIEALFSEHECELAVECLHNLMMNQDHEALIEAQLPRFTEILIRLLISGTVEIVERVLEIIFYFSDLKVGTRMLLARQPNFFSRLIALMAGRSSAANEKIAHVAAMIICNITVTAAARFYLRPLERDIFAICTADDLAAKSFCSILAQLQEDREKEREHAKAGDAAYDAYLRGDFFTSEENLV